MAALIVPAATPAPAPCHHPHFLSTPRRLTTTTTNHRSGSSFAPPPSIILVRWTPPPPGCFKLNFDGSVLHDGSGRATIGGVLRDCSGHIVFAFAERTSHAPIGFVEARALIRGLELVLEMGGFIANRPLLVEGDDLTLVRLLRGESRQTRIPLPMEDDILELLGRFRGGCEVRHIFREGNQVADKLTKEAYRCPGVWINNRLVPIGVWEKAEDDRHGVVHQRVRA
ncbi:hypothetical protein QOZ80_2BG0156830 [Eleusine coracana subsp. coracana]|nr:hypothetical protein QOZ80_2BG0156830 [Eleusine coracana subsp. coracana]